MSDHINDDGKFQSDKYPTCPAGKVPLSTKDPMAQDLLWVYAQRRRAVDAAFAADLETCLRADGFEPSESTFVLSERDRVAFFEALTSPPEPNEKLVQTMAASRALIRQDGAALREPQGPGSGINALLGKWPGDETDAEIASALEAQGKP